MEAIETLETLETLFPKRSPSTPSSAPVTSWLGLQIGWSWKTSKVFDKATGIFLLRARHCAHHFLMYYLSTKITTIIGIEKSYIWTKLRTVAQKTASQITLRNCSGEMWFSVQFGAGGGGLFVCCGGVGFGFGFWTKAPACGSSWARNRTHTTAATWATAVTALDP